MFKGAPYQLFGHFSSVIMCRNDLHYMCEVKSLINFVLKVISSFQISTMVRTYVKKRSKPEFSEDDMQRAIEACKKKELSLRRAAQVYGVTHTALFYRLKKKMEAVMRHQRLANISRLSIVSDRFLRTSKKNFWFYIF